MNFESSEEQQQLADSIGKYLANEYSFEKRKTILTSPSGLSDTAWTTFAELGLTSIALPEADGGFGGGALDLMAAMEACGEALVVEPLLDNIVGGRLVSRAGSAAQREAMLPGLMAGSLKLAFAGLEPGGRYALTPSNTHARAAGDGWVLDGEKCVVFGASSADTLIVSALAGPAGGVSLFLVDRHAAGVTLNPSRSVDGQRAADVGLVGVKLAAGALLGPLGAAMPLIEEAVDFATALLCADAIGAMKSANDATLEYMKTRKQFGVPIASFQVLQHRAVDMWIQKELTRSALRSALDVFDNPHSTLAKRRLAASSAKARASQAALYIAGQSVQLHGAIGFTDEYELGVYVNRALTLVPRYGNAAQHRQIYAEMAAK